MTSPQPDPGPVSDEEFEARVDELEAQAEAAATGELSASSAALLAGLVAKVVLEQPWGNVLQLSGGWNLPVAPLAHATGALCGLVCATLALARGPERRG